MLYLNVLTKMRLFYLQDNKWGNLVYLLLFLSFILIATTGIISYFRISDSLSNLKSRINQDFELNTIKSIQNSYIGIDNKLEMYVITHRKSYLTQLDSSSSNIRTLLMSLKMSRKITGQESQLIDSLKMHVASKIKNISNIVRFQQDKSIERLIEDYMNMQSIRTAMDRANNEAKYRRRKSGKKSGEKTENLTLDTLFNEQNLAKNDILELADSKNINPYLERDHFMNLKITEIIDQLVNMETDRLDRERIETENTIKVANRSIMLLGACTALFIILAAFVYFRYITQLSKIQRRLADSKDIAEELAMIKERFMANMSHEIRTPLNAISGFVDQLHASNLNYTQRKQTEIIQKSIQHILNIVNDILDFSKLNAGKLELNKKGFEIVKTLNQTVELLNPLIAEKNIHLQTEIDSKIPQVLIGDAYRLRQVLLNIIGNAIKYTIEGTITVKLKHKQTSSNSCDILIEVNDTGIGISKNELDNIFKEFHMAENAAGWNKAGSSGLGLSITKMLVELHNGKIEIDSELNRGTNIQIKIPYTIGSKSDLNMENSYLNDLMFLENKKIIVADDELFNRVLMNNILHKYNAQTFEAENGLHVLSILEREQIDCILMDVKMPELNGLQTTRRIRQIKDEKIATVPIIAVTAAMTHDNLKAFIDNKVDLFLEKPFKENELMDMLYKVMGKPNSNTSVKEKNYSDMPPEQPRKLFDLSELQRQGGMDPNFIVDMLETLFNSTRIGIEEIEKELSEERWDNVNLIAHRLASPLRFIMAGDAYNSIKQIENMTESELSISKEEIRSQFQMFKNNYAKLEEKLQEHIKSQLV